MPTGIYKRTTEHKQHISAALRVAMLGNKNMLGKKHTNESKRLMSIGHKGLPSPRKGVTLSDEIRKKISASKNGQASFRGKHHSEETKMAIRESILDKWLKSNKHWAGKNEKKLLDGQEQIDGCMIERNFIVIGYKPDGYCHKTNTVYEVYEKAHNRSRVIDLIREIKIIEHLNCNFVRIWDMPNTPTLYNLRNQAFLNEGEVC